MAVEEIASGLVGLCKEGKYAEAIASHYGDGIVSVEPMGDPATVTGIDAVRAKLEWFHNTMEVHSAEVTGPYVNGNQFAVRFQLDATDKSNGKRRVMDEIGVYTVDGDKIVKEVFFFGI